MLSFTSMKRFCIVSLLIALSAVSAFSQDKEWRPLSPQDVAAKSPVVEADADAEALFWEVRIDDSSSDDLSMRHYVRVKVFTEKGRERYSKFDVPFRKGLKIKDLQARVVKSDGSIVEIKKEDIFEREIVRAGGIKIKAKSFAVPGIEPGVIVEYRYKETIDDAGATGMRLSFQRDIPVRTLAYYYRPHNSKEPNYQNYNFTDTKFVKDSDGYWLASRSNVPAFKEEPRMPPEDTVRPWMMLTGTGFAITSVSNFSIMFVVKDQTDWKKYWGGVSGQKSGLVKFMNASSGDIKKTAAEITASASTPDEKLRKIYDFCQKEIKNVSYDTTLTDEDRRKLPPVKTIADVLKRRSGSWRYIDWLFGSLANAAGFDTRIAFSGDRSRMFFQPDMPDESLVHQAGIAVKVGEEYKFFSPGRQYLPYATLGWHEEDTWAILIGEDSFGWQKTPILNTAESRESRSGKLKLLEDGTLEGDIRVEMTGHPALNYRADYYDETDAKREESVKNEILGRISAAEVSNIVIQNLNDNSKPLVKLFKVRVPNYAQKTGKRLFLQPGFFDYGTNAVFSSATRKYDVYFRYPWSETDSFDIELPKGFELDSADAPATVADGQKISSLGINMAIDRNSNHLLYNRKFFFGEGGRVLFPAGSYTALKGLFDLFYKADTHVVTLKQK